MTNEMIESLAVGMVFGAFVAASVLLTAYLMTRRKK